MGCAFENTTTELSECFKDTLSPLLSDPNTKLSKKLQTEANIQIIQNKHGDKISFSGTFSAIVLANTIILAHLEQIKEEINSFLSQQVTVASSRNLFYDAVISRLASNSSALSLHQRQSMHLEVEVEPSPDEQSIGSNHFDNSKQELDKNETALNTTSAAPASSISTDTGSLPQTFQKQINDKQIKKLSNSCEEIAKNTSDINIQVENVMNVENENSLTSFYQHSKMNLESNKKQTNMVNEIIPESHKRQISTNNKLEMENGLDEKYVRYIHPNDNMRHYNLRNKRPTISVQRINADDEKHEFDETKKKEQDPGIVSEMDYDDNEGQEQEKDYEPNHMSIYRKITEDQSDTGKGKEPVSDTEFENLTNQFAEYYNKKKTSKENVDELEEPVFYKKKRIGKCARNEKDPLVAKSSCDLCNYTNSATYINSKHYLQIHFSRNHVKRELIFECEICDKKFGTAGDLHVHSLYHMYKRCEECGKSVQRRTFFKHARRHNPSYTYKFGCDICNLKFAQKTSLQNHIASVHIGKRERFPCDICGKSLASKANVKTHKSFVHDKIRNHLCDVCGKGFTTAERVRHHKQKHNTVPQYFCSVCLKEFKWKGGLNEHMKTHSDKRVTFTCPHPGCGKAFNQKASLKRHNFKHTGERPFECNLCKKTFNDRSILRKHKLGKHRQKKE